MTTTRREAARTFLRPGGPARRYAPLVALAVLAAVFGVIVAEQPESGLPLDPRGTGPTGTKALTLILEEVGADVSVVDAPGELDADTLLVLVDNFDEASADEVRNFARDGGTVFVADFSGLLSSEVRPSQGETAGFLESTLPRNCDEPALAGINRIRPGGTPLFVVPPGARGCFGADEEKWLIMRSLGDGTLITVGTPSFLTNALIGDSDNAALAAALLAPVQGTRVAILEPNFAPAGGTGVRSLRDLIPDRVVAVLAQLVIAFGIVVLWRARRLGKPVREPQPVQLGGSELVVAVGNLLQRTGSRERAAQLLQAELRRTLSERLGLPKDLPAEDAADVAAARTGVSRADLLHALTAPPPASDAGLVELAQLVESVRSALIVPALSLSGADRVARQ